MVRGAPGFATIDALVALTILSIAVVLSFTTLQRADAAVGAAREAQRAQTLIADLLETRAPETGVSEGRGDGFAWRAETAPTGAERPVEICRHEVRARHEISGRRYAAATLETCPEAPPS